jgi:hypothetical protein
MSLEFEVTFVCDLSYSLKVAILADIAEKGMDLEDLGTFHLGDGLIDYWMERTGNKFHVVLACWSKPMHEIEVS